MGKSWIRYCRRQLVYGISSGFRFSLRLFSTVPRDLKNVYLALAKYTLSTRKARVFPQAIFMTGYIIRVLS